VYAAKRLIGRKVEFASGQETPSWTSSYTIVEGPHADVRIKLRDKTYSVPEVSSMVLARDEDRRGKITWESR